MDPGRNFLLQLAILENEKCGEISTFFHKGEIISFVFYNHVLRIYLLSNYVEWRFYDFNVYKADTNPKKRYTMGMFRNIMRLFAPQKKNVDADFEALLGK